MEMAYIDPVMASPNHYKTLMENDQVRVVEMTLKVGEKDQQHSHPDETVYFIQGGTVKIHLPDGNAVDADLPDGHVMWHEAWTHTVENVGRSDIKAIIVERKG
jgi:beta-alanine degradation protein BauB